MQEASLVWVIASPVFASSGGDGHFLLGSLVYLALFAAAFLWFMRSWMDYIREYRLRHGANVVLPSELPGRHPDEPWRWSFEAFALSWRLTRISRQVQEDAWLEHLRKRVNRRRWVFLCVMLIGAAIPVILSTV